MGPAGDDSHTRRGETPVPLRWDASGMRSTHCDTASTAAGKADVTLNFGVRRAKEGGSAEVGIELRHRIVLTPAAAKSLHDLLARVIAEHEARRGGSK